MVIYLQVIVETTSALPRQSAAHRSPGREILDVAIAFALIECALWSPRPAQGIWAALAALWVTVATVRSHRSATELGITAAGLRQSFWVVPAGVAISTLILLTAWRAGALHVLTGARTPPWHAALYAIWALLQEYLLQSFFFVRLEAALGPGRALFWTAILFSLAHIPSPILIVATFLLALALTALFRRYRNIYALAIVHALLGLTIAVSFPPSLTHNMRVGIAWWM